MEVEQQEDNSMNNQSRQGGDSSYMPPPANDNVSLNDADDNENPLLNDGLLPSERKPLLIEQQRQQQIPTQYGLSSTNPNQFYTVTVDVYKAARINSILSELNFSTAPCMDPKQPRILLKIEQEDTVIQEIKKREVAYRKKLNEIKREEMKRRKIQEREQQKKIDRDKKRYQQPTSYTSTQYQQQVKEAIAKQEIQQQTQQQYDKYEQEQAFSVENKIEKKPSVDLLDENKNQEDSKNDSNVENQVSIQIENQNPDGEVNMVTEQNSQENDMSKLSPTPRKSERDKIVKNYKVLNDGRMSAEEEENNPLGNTTINLAMQQIGGVTGNPLGGPQAIKTPSQRNLVKTDPPKVGKNVTLEKMTELLERMKNHRFAHLFNCVKDTQQTLVMIVLNLKIGKKYTNTTQIGRDMREMVMKQIEATLREGKNDEYQQIVQFLDEFDEGFKNLDNLSLVKGPEAAVKPKPTAPSGSAKVTAPPKFTGSKPVTEIKTSKKEPAAKSTGKPVIPQTTPVKAAQPNGGYVQQATNGAIKNDGGGTSSGIINISTSNVQKMTQDEIDQLKDKINNKLNPEQQRGIVEIIKKDPIYQVSLQESGHNGQLELDLDKLTPEVARELEVYVNKEININNRRIKRQAADKARRQRQQAIKQQKQQLEKQRDQQQDASKQDVTVLANPQLNMQMKGAQVMPQVLAGGQTMAVNPMINLNQAQLIAAGQLNNLNQANLAGFQLQNAMNKGQVQPNQAQLQQLLLQQQLAAQNPGALQNIMNQQAAQALQKQAQLQVQSQVPAANKEEDNESSESSSDDDSD